MAFDAYSAPAPIEHPSASRHRLRCQLASLVERLIAAMDAIDGDPDFEDTGDNEPSLAHPEVPSWECQFYSFNWLPIGPVEMTDLEEADEDEGHDSDTELEVGQ